MKHERAIGELRRRLDTGTDFVEIADYFLDVVMELPGMKVTAPIHHELLEQVVRETLRRVMPESGEVPIMVARAKKTPLLHGMAQLPRALCAFFFFEDTGRGLLTVTDFAAPGRIACMRLTTLAVDAAVAAPGPATPS